MPRAKPIRRPKSPRMSLSRLRKILANVRQQKKETQARRDALRAARYPFLHQVLTQASAPAQAEDLSAAHALDDTFNDSLSTDICFNETGGTNQSPETISNKIIRREFSKETSATSAQEEYSNEAPTASNDGHQIRNERALSPRSSVNQRFLNAPPVASRSKPASGFSMRSSE
ncbi:hypothetical protein ACHAXS_011472 [Conticribra weissflogii]